jgi:hypothetical protein
LTKINQGLGEIFEEHVFSIMDSLVSNTWIPVYTGMTEWILFNP